MVELFFFASATSIRIHLMSVGSRCFLLKGLFSIEIVACGFDTGLRGEGSEASIRKEVSPQVHTVSFVKYTALQKSISRDFALEHQT